MEFKIPPRPQNADGKERKAGYEFEFTGLEMSEAAKLVKNLYGGTIHRVSTYEYSIKDSDFGTFALELDAQLLREKKYENILKSLGIDLSSLKNIQSIEGALKDLASSVVPFEIITPPIPLFEMQKLNSLIKELRSLKAKGTGSSVFYAFGMHINPEIPEHSAKSLLDHLKAYVLLDPWIRKDAGIDISRRMTPYIKEYKEDYLQLILSSTYKPDLKKLITDYFRFGNSRNRPLDMLPVFMHLDKEHTQKHMEESLTSGRPAYHYRLPNCSIEDENWSIADDWNRWVLVEILADDVKSLEQYSKAYLKMKKDTMVRFESKWIKLMDRWMNNVS
ncbi:MAG: amidoligase family protein [Balneolaceae bacterium]